MAKTIEPPGQEAFLDAIRRLSNETRAPLKEFLLKTVGVAAHHIRATAAEDQLFDVTYDSFSPLEEDRAWSVRLTPRQLKIFNVGSTTPVVTEVHLFARLQQSDPSLQE